MKAFRTRRCLVFSFLLVLTGVAVLLALPPAADSRSSSRLERLLEKSDFSAAGKAEIERAYNGCLKAGASRRDTLKIVEFCMKGDFGASQITRLLMVCTRLELASLPAETFWLKIREGVAKDVEPDDIVRAAEESAVLLNRAARIFNQLVIDGFEVDDRDELIPAMAEALAKGRSEGEIKGIITEILEDDGRQRKIRRALLR